jgi:hypothetical protein
MGDDVDDDKKCDDGDDIDPEQKQNHYFLSTRNSLTITRADIRENCCYSMGD